ncbi:MAG: DUF3520 domain-containing protein [Lentisphaeraceae bacterium]|nr:DUF3520 domain-containing protein [Lentisphaeraceae bacterium]
MGDYVAVVDQPDDWFNDMFREVTRQVVEGNKDEMMTVKLRYKDPDGDTSKLISEIIYLNKHY